MFRKCLLVEGICERELCGKSKEYRCKPTCKYHMYVYDEVELCGSQFPKQLQTLTFKSNWVKPAVSNRSGKNSLIQDSASRSIAKILEFELDQTRFFKSKTCFLDYNSFILYPTKTKTIWPFYCRRGATRRDAMRMGAPLELSL